MNRVQRTAKEVFLSLLANKQRALLMMTGVAVGVAALSAVIIMGQGTRDRIMEQVRAHNLDMVMVRTGGDEQVFAPTADRGLASLFESDARAIESEIPNIELVSVVQNKRDINLVFEDRATTTRAFGVDPSWTVIRHRDLADGEPLTDQDMASMGRVALLGWDVAHRLFPEGGAVGRTIRVENDPYVVKGVFTEVGTATAADVENFDDRLVVPFTTSSRRLFNRPYLEQIVMRVTDTGAIADTAERVRSLLRVRHNISPGELDDFFVREPEDVVGTALEAPTILFALMAATSVVALVAGGLVIMNLMLISISQRGPEIGLRRAMGAQESDITRQFLFEAIFVALLGGLAGVVLGIAGALGLAAFGIGDSSVTWVPFAASLAACLIIGLTFGIYPARKAAHLDPAAILRGRVA